MDQLIKKARWATSAVFFINGAVLATWVVYIPYVKDHLVLTEGALGIALLGMALGGMLSMPVAAALCQRYSSRSLTTISAFVFPLTLPLLFLAPGFTGLLFALLLFGASNGIMDVAMNAQAVEVEKKYSTPILSSVHGFFSLGGLFGSALGGASLWMDVKPLTYIVFISVSSLICVVCVFRFLIVEGSDLKRVRFRFKLPTGSLMGLGVLGFLVLMIEGSIADWSAVFLRESLMTSSGVAALGYAAFSSMMALGRFLGDKMVSTIGAVSFTRLAAIIVVGGLVLSLSISDPYIAVLGFGLVGFGVSNLIPILFRAASGLKAVSPGVGIATVATIGYFGMLAGPPFIGFTAELTTLPKALGLLVLSGVIVAVFASFAQSAESCSESV